MNRFCNNDRRRFGFFFLLRTEKKLYADLFKNKRRKKEYAFSYDDLMTTIINGYDHRNVHLFAGYVAFNLSVEYVI